MVFITDIYSEKLKKYNSSLIITNSGYYASQNKPFRV